MRQGKQTPGGRGPRRRTILALLIVAGTLATSAGALAAMPIPPVVSHAHANARQGARVNRLAAVVSGRGITVTGTVAVSPNTVAARRRVRVVLELDGVDHAYERHTVPLSAGGAYRAHWRTLLTGRLRLSARAKVGRKTSGAPMRRTVVVSPPGTTSTTPTPTGTPTGTPMLGKFQLAAGSAPVGQAPTGSYVEMLTGSGGPLANLSSPAGNKDYTTFTPGVDGGLSTVAYEPAPSPAFALGSTGSALANDIVQPVGFEGINFSIDTNPVDAETGQPDPIPQIYDNNGSLSGQVTAWDAQWNGQSFNQGTPKPDGSVPAPTTAVSGTYDASTGAFTLTWRSRIVGGPFNGFSGLWSLAGTFVPATP